MQRLPGNINPEVLQAAKGIVQACEPGSAKGVYTGLPYYSKGRMITAARTGAGPYAWLLAKGQKLRLFGYAIGDLMDQAGVAGVRAQDVDTNLTVGSETNAGEDLSIYGIGIQVLGVGVISDPTLLIQGFPEFSATIEMQGRKGRWDLGPLDMIPGAAGFYGAAFSGATNANVGAMSNGQPIQGNFLEIPGGIDWTDKGTDSQLVVTIDNARDITINSAFAGPTNLAVEFRVQLFCTQMSNRSNNQ